MPVPFFDIKRETKAILPQIEGAIEMVIESGTFILGPNVSAFEKELAEYCGTKFAVALASGTDALHLSLLACGIKPGDEVITTPFTFISTAEAIFYTGAIPVFVDIDEKTYNLDPNKIEEKITPKTKAILPVHLFGNPVDMNPVMKLAEKYSLKVIEDCAQSIGAEYNGKKAGSIGDFGAFSFFPTKNLGCFGDGGAITTNNWRLADEVKVFRNHGSRTPYHHDVIGYNSRLDEIQAAILRVKFKLLDSWISMRNENAAFYLRTLKDVVFPVSTPNSTHVYNQFTIQTKIRDELRLKLEAKGIGTNVYYPLSLHLQTAFRSLGYKEGDFPISESVQKKVLSLPIFPELNEDEILHVCEAINTHGQG